MLEIYKESLYDLLNPDTKPSELKIKEHPKKGIYIQNLQEEYISELEEFLNLIEEAESYRVVSETGLNKTSSRSHLLFKLEITQKLLDGSEKRGMLNLIDLAGSEKVSKTGAVGETLEEAKKINLSLSTLGQVISNLSSNNQEYIPYRDSKLTRILQDSLGGNYKTSLIVTCSPHQCNAEETISTLKFAKRAKKIKCSVKLNIKRSTEELELIIAKLTSELKRSHQEIRRLRNLAGLPQLPNNAPLYSGSELYKETIESSEKELSNTISNSYSQNNLGISNLGTSPQNLFISNQSMSDLFGINKGERNMSDKNLDYFLTKTENPHSEKFEIEIEKLKEEISQLKEENLNLKEKLDQSEELINKDYEKRLKDLRILNKENMDKFFEYLKEINLYKELYEKYEEEDFSGNELFNSELLCNFNNFHRNLDQIINELKSKAFEVDSSSSYSENIFISYENTLTQSKLFLKDILKMLVKKNDLFKSISNPFEDSIDNTSKIKMENIQLIFVSSFYEKMLFDVLNKIMIDISNFLI